jgi:hypothetical protein
VKRLGEDLRIDVEEGGPPGPDSSS